MPSRGPSLHFYPNTIWETKPFNFKYRDGEESFSFLLPPDSVATVTRLLQSGRQQHLKGFLLDRVQRGWDLYRCKAVAMRTTPEGQVEVRVKLGPPWYEVEEDEPAGREGPGATLDRPPQDGAV